MTPQNVASCPSTVPQNAHFAQSRRLNIFLCGMHFDLPLIRWKTAMMKKRHSCISGMDGGRPHSTPLRWHLFLLFSLSRQYFGVSRFLNEAVKRSQYTTVVLRYWAGGWFFSKQKFKNLPSLKTCAIGCHRLKTANTKTPLPITGTILITRLSSRTVTDQMQSSFALAAGVACSSDTFRATKLLCTQYSLVYMARWDRCAVRKAFFRYKLPDI